MRRRRTATLLLAALFAILVAVRFVVPAGEGLRGQYFRASRASLHRAYHRARHHLRRLAAADDDVRRLLTTEDTEDTGGSQRNNCSGAVSNLP